MLFAIGILLISGIIEIVLSGKLLWRARFFIGALLIPLVLIFTLDLLMYAKAQLFAYLFILVSFYRIFSIYRVLKSKIQLEHLRRISHKTAVRLWLAQVVLALFWLLFDRVHELAVRQWEILLAVDCAAAMIVVVSVLHNLRVTRSITTDDTLTDSNAPTLTVAIPARNETDNLNDCLTTLIASDYPKLEILVLDDQSTNRRTPEIIRSFAHDGVTFIPGKQFNEEWLAKNWAYQQLLESSNGDVILYCGADTRFKVDSLRFLVKALESGNREVLSIVPDNVMPGSLKERILQPLRYFWEIALPRRLFNRPPVLPTCWLARRSFLEKNGGFKAVSRRVSPESYFAKNALVRDGYNFFQYAGVLSSKPVSDQYETALRLRYPQAHRQPEMVALLTITEILGSFASIVLTVTALLVGNFVMSATGILAVIFFASSFGMVSRITYRRWIFSSFFLWPVALVCDLWILHLSMWRYEFGTVFWKGRSIAPSVMTHEPPMGAPLVHQAR